MYVYVIIYIYSTLWLFNIAIGNDPFQYLNQNKSSINGPFSMAMLDQYSFVEAGIFDPVLHGADTAGAGELPHRFFLTALQILGAVFVFFEFLEVMTTSLRPHSTWCPVRVTIPKCQTFSAGDGELCSIQYPDL